MGIIIFKLMIEILHNNQFLLRLFPQGINEFSFGRIELRTDNRVYFDIHTMIKPSMSISKWGEWGKDYNVLVIKVLAQFIQDVKVEDFQNNLMSSCQFRLDEVDGKYSLNFFEEDWNVKLHASAYTFLECSTYLIES